MVSHTVEALAQRAADLLPGPPPADDLDGYAAWCSLVDDTAARLALLAGVPSRPPLPSLGRSPVTWTDLLALAAVPRARPCTSSRERRRSVGPGRCRGTR